MELNRGIIKSQAKSLIKERTVVLFLVIALVSFIVSGGQILSSVQESSAENQQDSFSMQDPFSSFGSDNSQWDSDFFKDFGGNVTLTSVGSINSVLADVLDGVVSIANVASFLLSGMSVVLCGLFLQLIHGNYMGLKGSVKYIFKNTFDKHFWKRFCLSVLTFIIIGVACVAFVVPGVLLYYRWYFAKYVMAQKPGISVSQAWDVSAKITKNHRMELLKLDLSFVGWIFVCLLSCGVATIFVAPYRQTTVALYYENFKIRALQAMRVSDIDFMTEQERNAHYAQSFANHNQIVQNNTNFGSGEGANYFNKV